ncbi:hypothetical protein GCM10009714_39150 [Microlunatus capsulatus]
MCEPFTRATDVPVCLRSAAAGRLSSTTSPQNDLVLGGRRVLPSTWTVLTEDPEALVVAVLAALR